MPDLNSNRYGVTRAINEMQAIFACQWRNGMLPQIRFMPGQHSYRPNASDWGVTEDISGSTALPTSGITQPPIVGFCLYALYLKLRADGRASHHESLIKMSEGVEKYHDWLLRERDPYGEDLPLCLHPWETGTDNSPAFDPLIEATRAYIEETDLPVDTFGRADTRHVKEEQRPTDRDYAAYFGLIALFKKHRYNQQDIIAETPFLLQDILFNTLLVASLRALARLQSMLAEQDKERESRLAERAGRNVERAEAVAAAIRRKTWHEGDGLFYSYGLRGQKLLRTPTVSSLMPLMAATATSEQAERLVVSHVSNPGEFWTPMPLPSTPLNTPAFNPVRYWSGPSWPVTNWLVYLGLRERGSQLAGELRQRTLAMIEEGVGADSAREAAIQVMERHSHGEEFTTPSNRQYAHAWLWDSAIAAMSWPLVKEKPSPANIEEKPGFWEYYHPRTGEPLGAAPMTWTASLYLEMLGRE